MNVFAGKTGYIVWPQGDTGVHTCRVYDSLDAANNASDNPDEEVYDFYDGMTTAYEHVINYCRHMLGYSGTMPSEVPNQSEDAKE